MSIEFARDFDNENEKPNLVNDLPVPATAENEVCDHPECIEFRKGAKAVDEFLRELRDQDITYLQLATLFESPENVIRMAFDEIDEAGDFLTVKGAPTTAENKDEKLALVSTTVSGFVLSREQVEKLRDGLNDLLAD